MMRHRKNDQHPQPTAYDEFGRPLYLHPHEPNDQQQAKEPQVVYMSRAIDPLQQELSPEVLRRHEESTRKYPKLNLSDGEFVIAALKRHPVGLVSAWAVIIAVVIAVLVLPTLVISSGTLPIHLSANGSIMFAGSLFVMVILGLVSGLMYTYVYEANKFYLTNESVIQLVQNSIFSKRSQIISLGSVEDVSYQRHGLVQTLLNYGTVRLSTEGEETTYVFHFVHYPEKQTRMLNDAVEAFKNYRPVEPSLNDT